MSRPRKPAKASDGHLQWTHHGTVTATYFVESFDYGLRAPDDKEAAGDAHESLCLGCPNDTVLMSLKAPMDLVDVLGRSLDLVDLGRSPDYIKEALAGYDRIGQISPLTRINTITFPLGKHTLVGELTADEIAVWNAAAAEMVTAVDPENNFKLLPVPHGLPAYVWNHNLLRGAAMEMAPQDPTRSTASVPVTNYYLPGSLDPGARTELPWYRRFLPTPNLKVMVRQDDGRVLSNYQSVLTPLSFPAEMLFPGGSEFLSILDGIDAGDGKQMLGDISVDWAMRIRRLDRDQAMKANETALKKLNNQLDERAYELGFHNEELWHKVNSLGGYNGRLISNENAEEVQFTTALAVGAGTPTDLTRAVGKLKAKYRKLGIKLKAPRDAQLPLWMMLNPGADLTDDVYTDYEHIMTSEDWGGFVPFSSASLLDDVGQIIGVNLLSGLYEPLFFNFLNRALTDKSPAIALAGELGSGKSYFIKTLLCIIVDLLGRFWAIDRSKAGEYLPIGAALGAVVLDLGAPDYTWDPLQIFDDPVKARVVAIDSILPMLDIDVTSDRGKLFSKLLQPHVRKELGIRALADLRDYCVDVGTGVRTPENTDGGRRQLADDHLGIADAMDAVEAAVLFGRGLPAMPLDASATIIRTHTLSLPTPIELATPHLYNRLPWRKRLGHTLYELVGSLARDQFLRDDGRFGALVCDEAYHFTASQVGQSTIDEFVRDGRKHLASIILASHDPRADYAGVAHNLIPNRFGFRHTDKELAINTLDWLGVDVERDAYLIKQLRENTSPAKGKNEFVPVNRRGECFIADSRGRIGRGKILGPARHDRALAVGTTPKKAA